MDDLDDVLDVGREPHGRPARIAATVVAVLAVVAASLLVWAHSGSSGSNHQAAGSPSGSASPLPGPASAGIPTPSGAIVGSNPASVATPPPTDSAPPAKPVVFPAGGNVAATKARLAQLVAAAPRLPGSSPRSKPPSWAPDPSEDLAMDDKAQLVTHRVWWTAPGTVAAAEDYVEAHVDPSLKWGGGSTGSSGDGPTVDESDFDAPATTYAIGIELQVVFGPLDGGVAIGIRADAIWIPPRPAAETIVAPTSLEVTVTRTAKPSVSRTLDAAQTARLAAVVNGLSTVPEYSGDMSCPGASNSTVNASDTLAFTTAAGSIVVTVHFFCGQSYEVTVNGVSEPGLQAYPVDLDSMALKALGLPENYGISDN